jgi:hypothetical protein
LDGESPESLLVEHIVLFNNSIALNILKFLIEGVKISSIYIFKLI